jgi:hypothetical protein
MARTARRLLSDAYLAGLGLPDVIELLESTDRDLRDREIRKDEQQ